jgi:hypothetical protein
MHRAALATGVAWGTRDPMRAPQGKLRETRFEWVAALDGRWRAGVVCGGVEFRRVGVYVWPKELRKGEGDLGEDSRFWQ